MFAQPEGHSQNWRRANIPNLIALPEATPNIIARRWFYPENEYLFNSSAPKRDLDLNFQRAD